MNNEEKLRDQLDNIAIERMFRQSRAIDLKNLRVTPQDPIMNHGGGQWIGWAREYIQCKAINGEHVTWGSQDEVKFRNRMTVAEFERIAANIAACAVNEFIDKLNRDGVK